MYMYDVNITSWYIHCIYVYSPRSSNTAEMSGYSTVLWCYTSDSHLAKLILNYYLVNPAVALAKNGMCMRQMLAETVSVTVHHYTYMSVTIDLVLITDTDKKRVQILMWSLLKLEHDREKLHTCGRKFTGKNKKK